MIYALKPMDTKQLNMSYPIGCAPFFMFEFTPNNNSPINECVPCDSQYNKQVIIEINTW
jgi:hypothetical protein